MISKKKSDIDFSIDLKENRNNKNQSFKDLNIILDESIYSIINKFSQTDLKNEQGGFLIGEFINKDGKNILKIYGFLEAKYVDSKRTSLTFTHKTWENIHSEKEQYYPNASIVGWFHTHPGFGVFLSEYDKFIQKNFFNLPWQVAYVIDPIQKSDGFFRWVNNSIEPVDGFKISNLKINTKNKSHKNKENLLIDKHIKKINFKLNLFMFFSIFFYIIMLFLIIFINLYL